MPPKKEKCQNTRLGQKRFRIFAFRFVPGVCVGISAHVSVSATGLTCDGKNDCGAGNDLYNDELMCESKLQILISSN